MSLFLTCEILLCKSNARTFSSLTISLSPCASRCLYIFLRVVQGPTFAISKVASFVSESERVAINRLVSTGYTFEWIQKSINRLGRWKSLYVKSFASALYTVTGQYINLLTVIEADALQQNIDLSVASYAVLGYAMCSRVACSGNCWLTMAGAFLQIATGIAFYAVGRCRGWHFKEWRREEERVCLSAVYKKRVPKCCVPERSLKYQDVASG